METLLANVPGNGKFLYSVFSRFDGRDAMAFFEALGVPLKTERGNRASFPMVTRAGRCSSGGSRRWVGLAVRDRAVRLEIEEGTIRGVRESGEIIRQRR